MEEIREIEHVEQDPADRLWYFWDETQTERIGPYDCARDARMALGNYADFLTYGAVGRTATSAGDAGSNILTG